MMITEIGNIMNNYFVNVTKPYDIPTNIGRGKTIAVKDEINVQKILDSYKHYPSCKYLLVFTGNC